jgi:hypothetical protein
MADAKRCPDCGNPMQLYGLKAPAEGTGLGIGAEIIRYIAVVVLPIVLWALGIRGSHLVIASVLIVVVAVFWKPYGKAQRGGEEQYYCEACHGYFEGSGLRRITEAEAKRAKGI